LPVIWIYLGFPFFQAFVLWLHLEEFAVEHYRIFEPLSLVQSVLRETSFVFLICRLFFPFSVSVHPLLHQQEQQLYLFVLLVCMTLIPV